MAMRLSFSFLQMTNWHEKLKAEQLLSIKEDKLGSLTPLQECGSDRFWCGPEPRKGNIWLMSSQTQKPNQVNCLNMPMPPLHKCDNVHVYQSQKYLVGYVQKI